MKPLRLLLILALTTGIAACDKIPFLGGGGDPADTARQYWAAMARNDLDAAGEFAVVTGESNVSIDQSADMTLSNLVVADAQVGGDRATSRTTMHASGDGQEADLDFQTTIVKVDGDWKVDQNATLEAMMSNAMEQLLGADLTQLGESMADAMGDAVRGMAEDLADAAGAAAQQQPTSQRPAARRAAVPRFDDEGEMPWDPEFTGTIDPGMTREQVVAAWGEPVEERFVGNRSYMYYRNGCERSCGMFDLVLLEGQQVVDAVVRGPGHVYSGASSSPPGRIPEETLPGAPEVPAPATDQGSR